MDEIEHIKEDVRQGRIDAERLVELLVKLQRRLDEATRRIAELEKQLGPAATSKVTEPFSICC